MKRNDLKQWPILICSFILFIMPFIVFADCPKTIYIERPKMQWYLDECGEWRQGYPEDYYGDSN